MTNTLKEMSLEANKRVKFGDGPISGNADDIAAWKEARKAWQRHKELYSDVTDAKLFLIIGARTMYSIRKNRVDGTMKETAKIWSAR